MAVEYASIRHALSPQEPVVAAWKQGDTSIVFAARLLVRIAAGTRTSSQSFATRGVGRISHADETRGERSRRGVESNALRTHPAQDQDSRFSDSQQYRSSLLVASLLGARVVRIVFSGAAAKSLGGVGG